MSMQDLLMTQMTNMLKASGVDFQAIALQVVQAVEDIKAMKASQDRCEAYLKVGKLADFAQYIAMTDTISEVDRLAIILHMKHFQLYGFSTVPHQTVQIASGSTFDNKRPGEVS